LSYILETTDRDFVGLLSVVYRLQKALNEIVFDGHLALQLGETVFG